MKFITLKVGGSHEVNFGGFRFFMGQAPRALNFILFLMKNPTCQVVHNHHLLVRGNVPPILCIICERYWLLNVALTQGLLMGPPPKQSYANLIHILTCLEYEVFISYFGPHGSPTLVDTFHPRKLPPSGSETPSKNQVATQFELHKRLRIYPLMFLSPDLCHSYTWVFKIIHLECRF